MTLVSRSLTRGFASVFMLTATAALIGCGGDDAPVATGPAPGTANTTAPTAAVTVKGTVNAVDANGMLSYFAIPYAKPPLAALRWTAPQAPDAWTTARAAAAPAAPCLQTSASPFRLTGDSEDCLYLDVHTPTGTGPFPVMVWIHGGAFNTGGTVTYKDPSPLVSKGVVVVNIAYRLGAMGFLGHPALADANGAAGNYGIMDQQLALNWVKDNIQVFAGDKSNVTIFGESAGGASVLTHLAAPSSAGLFHKAIVQSGGYVSNTQLSLADLKTRSTAVVTAAMAAATVTCNTVDAACLRGLPDAVVKTQLATAFNASMSSPVPSVDTKVLSKTIKQTFIDGTNNKVALINGSNEDEYSLFLAISELGRRAAATPPNFDPANTSFAIQPAAYTATLSALTGLTGAGLTGLVATYPLANYGANPATQPTLGAVAAATDLIFACTALRISERASTQTAAPSVWGYEFRDQTAVPTVGLVGGTNVLSFAQGAGHSYEIPYIFNTMDIGTAGSERRALQTTITNYWTNFAKSGNPNTGTTVPAWGTLSTNALIALDVTAGGGVAPLTKAAFDAQHKCSTFWTLLTF